jgi:hypothetical protein
MAVLVKPFIDMRLTGVGHEKREYFTASRGLLQRIGEQFR